MSEAARAPWIDGPAEGRVYWTFGAVAERWGYSVDVVEQLVKMRKLKAVALLDGQKGRRVSGKELARYERDRDRLSSESNEEPVPAVIGERKHLRRHMASATSRKS